MENKKDKNSLKIDLPSGAALRATPADFTKARELYQVLARELTKINVRADDEINVNLIKNCFLILISSKELEEAIWGCMDRALYNDVKIDIDTFADVDARQDYIEILKEVAMFNIAPFTKSLFADFEGIVQKVEMFSQAQR